MYQALYRKWRPQTFADVVGQQHVTDTLRAQLQSGRVGHAYLFTGTRGTGKTTCAKILARAVNCEHPVKGEPCNECATCRGILNESLTDVIELDAASNNGVDNIRDIIDETRYTPAQAKKRVFIIDEVHMLSSGAFNALLKTLEEPPAHVIFILATTELNKVPVTILSRCLRFDFHRIRNEDIARRLLEIAAAENIRLTEGAAQQIALLADGALRDALSLLDRAAANGAVNEENLSESLGVFRRDDNAAFVEFLKNNDLVSAVSMLGQYYEAGRDMKTVYEQVLELIRDMLIVKMAQQGSSQAGVSRLVSPVYSVKMLQKLSDGLALSTLVAWSRVISETLTRMRMVGSRRVEAELCAVRLCSLRPEDYDTLGGRVDAIEEKLKNGIPVQQAAPAAAGKTAKPNENAPIAAEPPQKAAPDAQEKQQPAPDTEASDTGPALKRWPKWPAVKNAMKGKIGLGILTVIEMAIEGVEEDGKLVLLCDDDTTRLMASKEPLLQLIRDQAEAVNGAPIPVKVRLKDNETVQKKNDAIEEIKAKASKLDIPVNEF